MAKPQSEKGKKHRSNGSSSSSGDHETGKGSGELEKKSSKKGKDDNTTDSKDNIRTIESHILRKLSKDATEIDKPKESAKDRAKESTKIDRLRSSKEKSPPSEGETAEAQSEALGFLHSLAAGDSLSPDPELPTVIRPTPGKQHR